jgi:hypothetical protein
VESGGRHLQPRRPGGGGRRIANPAARQQHGVGPRTIALYRSRLVLQLLCAAGQGPSNQRGGNPVWKRCFAPAATGHGSRLRGHRQAGSQYLEPATDPNFEKSLVLREFLQPCPERSLRECCRTGVLSSPEYELLSKVKLEGFGVREVAGLTGGPSAAAVHRHLQRIMSRLRRAAVG